MEVVSREGGLSSGWSLVQATPVIVVTAVILFSDNIFLSVADVGLGLDSLKGPSLLSCYSDKAAEQEITSDPSLSLEYIIYILYIYIYIFFFFNKYFIYNIHDVPGRFGLVKTEN